MLIIEIIINIETIINTNLIINEIKTLFFNKKNVVNKVVNVT